MQPCLLLSLRGTLGLGQKDPGGQWPEAISQAVEGALRRLMAKHRSPAVPPRGPCLLKGPWPAPALCRQLPAAKLWLGCGDWGKEWSQGKVGLQARLSGRAHGVFCLAVWYLVGGCWERGLWPRRAIVAQV